MSRFLRQSIRLSLRILSCDERKIVILTVFVQTFCDIRFDSFGHRLGSLRCWGSSLLSVRLAYSGSVHYLWHTVAFLAELPRFENSQNVKMTVINPAFLES